MRMEDLAEQIVLDKVTHYLLLQINVIQAIPLYTFDLIINKFNASNPFLQVITC